MNDPGGRMLDYCRLAPVIPVLVIEDAADAVPLARALVAGGLKVLEVTLRTATALEGIEAIRQSVPDAIVGAGTLRAGPDVHAAHYAGAQFGVSPGAPDALLDVAERAELPFLPGAATPTEAMRLADRGYRLLKLFPAEAVGGVRLLKSLAGPLPDIAFCPTGGITAKTAPDYLSLPNVVSVGGSWLTPEDLMRRRDWRAIEALASEANAVMEMAG